MFKHEYDQIIRENFDLSDKYTRQYIANLEESGQEQLLAALSSALYDKIAMKVDDIDFGTIPQSRGDITKVEGFEKTEQCMDIIRKLVIQYNQKTDVIDTVITASNNIKDRKNLFVKGFSINAELPVLMYNLMVLSVERSVSLMIATCLQFVRDPQSSTPKTALDKVAYQRTMDDTLYKQLASFNSMCKNKSIDKILENSMKGAAYESVYTFDTDSFNDSDINADFNPFGDSPADPASTVEPFKGENEPTPGFDPAANVETIPAPNEETPDIPGDASEDVPNDKLDDEPADEPTEDPATAPDEEKPAPSDFPEDTPSTPVPDVSKIIDGEEAPAPIAKSVALMIKKDDEEIPAEVAPEEEKPPVAGAILNIIKKPEDAAPTADDVSDDVAPTDDNVDANKIPEVTPHDDTTSPTEPVNEEEDKPNEDKGDVDVPTTDSGDNNVDEATKFPNLADLAGMGAKKLSDANKNGGNAKKIATVVAITAAIAAAPFIIAKVIIPGLRYLTYLFYFTSMKVSDYLDIQSALIEANATELENSTDGDTNKKKKIADKQHKWADRLHNWANKFAVDHKTASNKAKSASASDERAKKTVSRDSDGDDSIF